jgi:tetratricopeptide (TPR) repeat protein
MKKIILLLFIGIFSGMRSEVAGQSQAAIKDNEELKTLYKEDQSDRMSGNIDWPVVSKRDKMREARVNELLAANLVRTARDYANAAMIFQHGVDTTASGMAVKMMRKAVALDPSIDKWLLAAAIDRDLMRREQPQIYGTQFGKMGDQPWELYKIDTTKVSDEERRAYRVGSLAEQREKVKMMNKKQLSALLANGKNIDEIVKFCRQADKGKSEYNLSEAGINSFGYELMAQKKEEEALKIFRLNTVLYPAGANTYDSLGECLLKLGRKKEAITAYKKSLELNPKNSNAENALAGIAKK